MDPLFRDASRAGVFQCMGDPAPVAHRATAAGLQVYRVDIGAAHGKADFLACMAQALDVPPDFGANWDALLDVLRDLSWLPAPGWVILLEGCSHFGAAHPGDCETALEILTEAGAFWRGEGKPFWVLLAGPAGWDSGRPALPPV